jgi:hypothetical protein
VFYNVHFTDRQGIRFYEDESKWPWQPVLLDAK